MNKYKMEMSITCAGGDADHFYNTVLMIAKGFEIGVLESKLGPLEPVIEKVSISVPPDASPVKNVKKNITLKEASEYLNLSKEALYKYTSEATIPYYKIGSRILFKTEELDAWLKDRKVK